MSKEEYNTFYKSTFKEFMDPQAYTHFTTEVCSLLPTLDISSSLLVQAQKIFPVLDALGH